MDKELSCAGNFLFSIEQVRDSYFLLIDRVLILGVVIEFIGSWNG